MALYYYNDKAQIVLWSNYNYNPIVLKYDLNVKVEALAHNLNLYYVYNITLKLTKYNIYNILPPLVVTCQ